jgi:plasmid stabilization system protein ParE
LKTISKAQSIALFLDLAHQDRRGLRRHDHHDLAKDEQLERDLLWSGMNGRHAPRAGRPRPGNDKGRAISTSEEDYTIRNTHPHVLLRLLHQHHRERYG